MIGTLRTVAFDAPDHHALAKFYLEVLALGASRLPGGGGNWRVYADPAAHPFCLQFTP